MTARTARRWGLATLVAFAAGCSNEESPASASVPTVEARVDLVIGASDGPDEYIFGRIGGMALGPKGQIYVADAQADEVREYDATGEYVRRLAGRGAGPGEVGGPCCLTVDRDGVLWLRDTGNARYNAYDIATDPPFYRELRRMSHGSAGYWVAPTFSPVGHLIDVGHRTQSPIGPELVRFFLDSSSAVTSTETVPSPPSDSLSMYTVERKTSAGLPLIAYLYQPFGPQHLVAHSPHGGWATAVSSRYAVRWIGPDSTFDRRLSDVWVGPALSAGERARADSSIERDRARWEVPRGQVPFDVPTAKPPLRALQFDALGRLWVFLTVEENAVQLADVYDRAGRCVLRVSWPADVDLRGGYLGDGTLLGVRRDDLDVPYVVRLSLPVTE